MPYGSKRQFNLLNICMDDCNCTVTVNSRIDSSSQNAIPSWEIGYLGSSQIKSYSFDVILPKSSIISNDESIRQRLSQLILTAEKDGINERFCGELEKLDVENILVRKFLLDACIRTDNQEKLIEIFCNPKNNAEAISIVGYCAEKKNKYLFQKILNADFVKSSVDPFLKKIIIDTRIQLGF